MFDNIKYRLQEIWLNFLGSSLVEKIRLRYESLPEREQRIVKFVGIGLAILIVINVLYSFASGISEKEKEIKKVVAVMKSLDELNDFVSMNKPLLQARKGEVGTRYISLLDLVERQQKIARIKSESRVDIKETPRKEVEGGKYYENTANVKYKKITIRQLTKLLFGIERNAPSAKISTLRVERRTDDIRYIDVEFDVVARSLK